jgi:hypothetical protein
VVSKTLLAVDNASVEKLLGIYFLSSKTIKGHVDFEQ